MAFNAEVAEGADGAEAEKADEAPTAELNEAPEETPKAEARLQAEPWEIMGMCWVDSVDHGYNMDIMVDPFS